MSEQTRKRGSLVLNGRVFFVSVLDSDIDQAIEALTEDPDKPWEIPIVITRLSAQLREGEN